MVFVMTVTSMTTRVCALIAKREKTRVAQCVANVPKDMLTKMAFVNPANSIVAPTALKTSKNAISAQKDKFMIWI